MSLVTGARRGPYEIVSPLGVGGMGELYRARDTRLERMVAIKILLTSGRPSVRGDSGDRGAPGKGDIAGPKEMGDAYVAFALP